MSENKVFHLDSLEMLWQEFLRVRARHAKDKKWLDEFKDTLKRLAGEDVEELKLAGRRVALMSPGQINRTALVKEQPDVVAECTRMMATERFDEQMFKERYPDLFKQYQAQRLTISEGAPPIEGIA